MQANQRTALPRKFGFALALLAVLVPPCALGLVADVPVSGEPDAQYPRPAETLILALGDSSWQVRERATQELIELGADSVGALRAALTEAEPEVIHRIEWILSHVDPIVAEVRLVRWQHGEPGPFQFGEVRLTGVGEQEALMVRSRGRHAAISLELSLLEGREPWAIRLRFAADRNDADQTVELNPGGIVVVREEQIQRTHRVGLHYRQEEELFLWTLELVRAGRLSDLPADADRRREEATSDEIRVSLEPSLEAALASTQPRARRAAYRIAAFRGRGDLLASAPEFEITRDRWNLARLQAGDPAPIAALEALMGEAPDDSPTSEDLRLHEQVALALAQQGSARGLATLLDRLGTLDTWEVFQACQFLVDAIRDGRIGESQLPTIFGAFCSSGVFPYLRWSNDGYAEELFVELIDRVDEATLRQHFLPLLVAEDPGSGLQYLRGQAVLRALRRALKRFPAMTPEVWVEPALRFLGSNLSCREAFTLFRDLRVAGQLPDDAWQSVLEQIVNEATEPSVVSRLTTLYKALLGAKGLKPGDYKALWLTRTRQLVASTSHQQRTWDRELRKRFEDFEPASPATRDVNAWRGYLETWAEFLEEQAEEGFLPPGEEPEFRLTEVELRVDEYRGESEVLDFFHSPIAMGECIVRSGPGGADWSVYLSEQPTSQTRYLTLDQRRVELGVPLIARRMSPSRPFVFRLVRGDYNPTIYDRNPGVTNQLVRLLLPIDSDPIDNYQGLADVLVARLRDGDAKTVESTLDAIAKLNLEAALPSLRTQFDEIPSADVARTLLQLGDRRGIDYLRENLDQDNVRKCTDGLRALVSAGDAKSVELTLRWLVDPPVQVKRNLVLLLRILDDYRASHPEAVDEKRWIEALVGSLDNLNAQTLATNMLRSITGESFGFQEIFRGPRAKQAAARKRAVQKWRDWWEGRRS